METNRNTNMETTQLDLIVRLLDLARRFDASNLEMTTPSQSKWYFKMSIPSAWSLVVKVDFEFDLSTNTLEFFDDEAAFTFQGGKNIEATCDEWYDFVDCAKLQADRFIKELRHIETFMQTGREVAE